MATICASAAWGQTPPFPQRGNAEEQKSRELGRPRHFESRVSPPAGGRHQTFGKNLPNIGDWAVSSAGHLLNHIFPLKGIRIIMIESNLNVAIDSSPSSPVISSGMRLARAFHMSLKL